MALNIAWWKIELGMRPKPLAYNLLTYDSTNIYYNKNPIIFIHNHFNQKSKFNEVICFILKNSEEKSYLLKLILYFFESYFSN